MAVLTTESAVEYATNDGRKQLLLPTLAHLIKGPIIDIPSTCLGRANPYLMITRPELAATFIRPWLGSIQVIHGWKLGAVGVAPWQQ